MSGTKQTVNERCSDVQFQPNHLRRDVFQLRRLITKSCEVTLPVTEMMAPRRLQTRTIFGHAASLWLYVFGNLFSGHLVPLCLVALFLLFLVDRCTCFVLIDSVCSF